MPLSSGTLLGPYEILGILGVGGMGELYRAKDTRLGRDVAIKLLPPGVGADPLWLRRFETEARAVSALNHPNILTIHDFGHFEQSPFLVLELLEGQTLREKLSGGALSANRVLEIGLELAKGLAAAHEKGVIHRDLKPENIFITKDRRVKILDFGLAKVHSQPVLDPREVSGQQITPFASLDSSQTQAGVLVGTMAYMSPEQAKGEEVDARSDIFSLGVILWEMLAGKHPFQRPSPMETLIAIVRDDPPDLEPSLRVPPVLERAILGCLAKAPEARFPSLHNVIFALQAVSEMGASAASLANEMAAAAFVAKTRKKMWPWMAAGACVLALYAGTHAYRAWGAVKAEAITSIAVLPLQNYSGDAQQDYFAEGMTEALISDLAQIKALKVISRTSVMQYKDAKKPIQEIARELGVQSVLEGSVSREGNQVRVTVQLIDARNNRHVFATSYERNLTDVLSLQRELVREIAAQIRIQVTHQEQKQLGGGRNVDPKVLDAVLKGRTILEYATTEPEIRSALKLFRQALSQDPGYAPGWAGLSEALWQLAATGFEFVPAVEVKAEAIAAAEKALVLDPELPEAHNARGQLAIGAEWDLAKGIRHYEKAIQLRPGYANCRFNYAQILFFGLKRFDEAELQLQAAREIDPFSPWKDFSRIWMLTEQQRWDEATREGWRMHQEERNNWLLAVQIGHACLAKEDFAGARRAFEAARKILGPEHPFASARLAQACALTGSPSTARHLLRSMKDLAERRHVPDLYMAMSHAAVGEMGDCYKLLERALETREPGLVILLQHEGPEVMFRRDSRWPDYRKRVIQAFVWPSP